MKTINQYILLTITLLLVYSSNIYAQPVNKMLDNVVMPTPNAAALGKYSDIPVSYYTGVPNIGIPIHTLKEGPLSLPISLSYHASGVKVGETASWVGLGWSLNAGGMIARTVQGLPDEKNAIGYLYEGADLSYNLCTPGSQGQVGDPGLVAQGNKDGEPDIFSFNVGGYTGKFYLNPESGGTIHSAKAILIPMQDVKIEYNLTSSNQLKQFIITTPDGVKYYFGTIDEDNDEAIDRTSPNAIVTDYISTWYLRKVESHDGKFKILLDYVEEKYSYTHRVQQNSFTGTGKYPSTTGTLSTVGVRLDKITTSTTTVNFIPNSSNRQDLGYYAGQTAKSLKIIEIESGGFCKKYELFQSYFEDNSSYKKTSPLDYCNKRLRLDSLKESSCNNTINDIPAYTFDYHINTSKGNNFLPNILSKAIDHWGFYNGADSNNSSTATYNIPNTYRIVNLNSWVPYFPNQANVIEEQDGTYSWRVKYAGTANRDSDEASMKIGTLERINYPTGGYHDFDMEANECYGEVEESDLLQNTDNTCYYNAEKKGNWINFTPDRINFVTYQISLSNINGPLGSACAAPAIININLYKDSENNQIASTSLNANAPLLYPNNDAAMPIRDLFSQITFQAGANYKFGIFVEGGEGHFKLFDVPTYSMDNIIAGGLRIKKLTAHDGVSNDNDVVKMYEYSDLGAGSNSSGILYDKPVYARPFLAPIYQFCSDEEDQDYDNDGISCNNDPDENCGDPNGNGIPCQDDPNEECGPICIDLDAECADVNLNLPLYNPLIVYTILFDNSIVPLSSFEGYHIGYGRVIEHFVDNTQTKEPGEPGFESVNGSKELLYYTEHSPYSGNTGMNGINIYNYGGDFQFPIPPTAARIEAGNVYQ